MNLFPPFPFPPPRCASPAEEARLRAAFDALLAEDPDTPPGPKALCDAMGWTNRQMNGRTSKLRRKWLQEGRVPTGRPGRPVVALRAETLHSNATFRDPEHPRDDPCSICEAEAATYPPAPEVRTKWHDGLEFVVPTWDPAPTPWNTSGSWASDPDLEARLREGIKAAVPNHNELTTGALQAKRFGLGGCLTFWGSHGCDREPGHPGLCVCTIEEDGPCSAGLKFGDDDTFILWWGDDSAGLRLSVHHWTWFS